MTAPKPIDSRAAIIESNKITEQALVALEDVGIVINYDELYKSLVNSAITSADFQKQYPWQLVFFAADIDNIQKFLADKPTCKDKVTAREGYGPRIPLFAAALGGNIPAMQYYLEQHQQEFPERETKNLIQEALYYAARAGSVPAMEWLIKQGANPAQANKAGSTILHCAAVGGHVDAMKFASLHVKPTANNIGNTPLHIAVESQVIAAVQYCLQDLKLDPKTPNKNHVTPAQLAGDSDNPLYNLLHAPKSNKVIKALTDIFRKAPLERPTHTHTPTSVIQ
jgi:hypothetical protein